MRSQSLLVANLLFVLCCEPTKAMSLAVLSKRIEIAIKDLSRGSITLNTTEANASSCVVRSYKRTFFHKGCISKTVKLKYCYGGCNSLHLPGNAGYQDTLAFCESCMPRESHWKMVKLCCPFSMKENYKRFKVQVIESCECNICKK